MVGGVGVGVGMHEAGMLARWAVGCAGGWNAGWGECIARISSRSETTKLCDVTLEYWYLDDACSRVIRIYL